MPHSSSHPCSWCNIKNSNLNEIGQPRSYINIKEQFNLWNASGSQISKAKFYENCTNLPVVLASDPNQKVLDIIPPPELHLLLGTFNTIP